MSGLTTLASFHASLANHRSAEAVLRAALATFDEMAVAVDDLRALILRQLGDRYPPPRVSTAKLKLCFVRPSTQAVAVKHELPR